MTHRSSLDAVFRGLLSVLVMLWAVTAQAAPQTRDPMTHFFHQGFGDLPDELATARTEGKLGLLVMFDNAECPWCQKMKATVFNQVRVQDYYRKYFRIVAIDTEGDAPMVDFSGKEMAQKDFAFKHNRVRATPVFIFFDLDGKKLVRYTGATRNAEEFLWLGEFVVEGHYRSKRFTAFKREKLAASRR